MRPDFLLLRTLGQALVLWDAIQPTEQWFKAQVPDVFGASSDAVRAADWQERVACLLRKRPSMIHDAPFLCWLFFFFFFLDAGDSGVCPL